MATQKEKYRDKLKHPKWYRKRNEAMIRDDYRCTVCGDTESELHVHHEEYNGDPWDAPLSKLKTVCKTCHEIEHGILTEVNADAAVNKLLDMKDAICRPLINGVPEEKETQILKAAMRIDQTMIKIRRTYGGR